MRPNLLSGKNISAAALKNFQFKFISNIIYSSPSIEDMDRKSFFYFLVSTISAGGVQYQITPSGGAISQGVVMANAAGATIATAGHTGEETSRKRELRLLKNRYRKLKNRCQYNFCI